MSEGCGTRGVPGPRAFFSKLARFKLGLQSLPRSSRFLLCRMCAAARSFREEQTVGLGGMLVCEDCGAVGIQGPGWTHQIGSYRRPVGAFVVDDAMRQLADALGACRA